MSNINQTTQQKKMPVPSLYTMAGIDNSYPKNIMPLTNRNSLNDS
jgi:hypothetical protein